MTKKREIQHEGKAVENVSKATERVRKRERIKRIVSGGKKQRASQRISRKRQKESRRNRRNEPGLSLFFSFLFCRGGSREELVINPLAVQSMALFPLCKTTAGQYNLSHCSTSSAI